MLRSLRFLVVWVGLVACVFGAAACESASGSPPPAETTGGVAHTVDMSGNFHAPGLRNPMSSCTECHGADLRGGQQAPSCYSCHGRQW